MRSGQSGAFARLEAVKQNNAFARLSPNYLQAGATILQPIFLGGALNADIASASARKRGAVAAYGAALLGAFREVEVALANESYWRVSLPVGAASDGVAGSNQTASDLRLAGAALESCRFVRWQAFNQPDQEGAVAVWRHFADQLCPRWPKLGALMDGNKADVLAYLACPAQNRTKLHRTNPLELLSKDLNRRADVVGIFLNEGSILRLIGTFLFEQNDDWQSQHRDMMVNGFSQIDCAQIDPLLSIATQAA